MRRVLLASALASLVAVTSVQAQDLLPEDNGIYTYHQSPRWRESEAHPLRIAAYIVHPIGWVLREGVFRPFSDLRAAPGSPGVSSDSVSRMTTGSRSVSPEAMRFRIVTLAPYASSPTEEGDATAVEDSAIQEQRVVFPDIAFEFDKHTLNALGKARVRQTAQMLASMPTVNVVVEGHTDIVGSDEYNMKLGVRRAESVIAELSELGIDRARMSSVSYGESRPLFTEDTDWARAANRRVQFSVQGATPATPAPAAIPPAAS